MNQVRLGLTGCGIMGTRHLWGYKELLDNKLPVLSLEAVCDTDEARARNAADLAEANLGKRPQVYADITTMLIKEKGLDAVDVTTFPATHHVVTQAAFEAGVSAVVERPMGLTIRADRAMIEGARKHGVTLGVHENYRRDPMNRLVKAALESGVIGQPYLYLQYSSGGGDSIIMTKWRHMKLEGTIALDMGVMYTGNLIYFLGDVEQVFGDARLFEKYRYRRENSPEGLKVVEKIEPTGEDSSFAVIKMRNGAVAHWCLMLSGHGEAFWERRIYGSAGSIVAPPDRSGNPMRVQLDESSVAPETFLKSLAERAYDEVTMKLFPTVKTSYKLTFQEIDRKTIALEMYDFADALLRERRPEVDGEEGLKAEAVACAIFESSHMNQPVRVQDVVDGAVEGYQREINEALGIK